jgi:hypothetical protein
MVEYLLISSVMNGIWRSLCNVKFETYHGTLVMVRSIFDWSLRIILVFDGVAHPHSWIPYAQIGFNMHLYIKVLFSREDMDFRPKSHDIYRTYAYMVWQIWKKLKQNMTYWLRNHKSETLIGNKIVHWVYVFRYIASRLSYEGENNGS